MQNLLKIPKDNTRFNFIHHGIPSLRTSQALTHSGHFTVSFARSEEEVKECQALRYQVFAEEMGAHLSTSEPGIDQDVFDAYCDHLLVRNTETLEVVGSYRILAPEQARKIGTYYSESEFFLTRLKNLMPRMAEAGRSCVHPNYRTGGVIMLLWAGVAQYMRERGYEYLIGCASMSMHDGGHEAASLFRQLRDRYITAPEHQTFPKQPLPLNALNGTLQVGAPPLIKGYLRLGAQICSAPAWDPDFNTADFLVLLSMSKMNPRYARHFGL